jgi:Flp pilus assembly pilin Flp
MRRFIERFVREEDGMELLEWSIVAVLFCLAGAGALLTLTGQGVTGGMTRVINVFNLAP